MSAAIVKLSNRIHNLKIGKSKMFWEDNLTLIGWDYGQPVPVLDPKSTDIIVMVDISFPSDVMCTLQDHSKLIWLDHHISAMKDAASFYGTNNLSFINGIRDPKFAVCELTWKYFFPEQEMPEIIRLLGRYDCFGLKGTPEEQKVLEFQYGARQCITNPEEAYYELVDNISCDNTELKIWNKGKAIYSYLCTEAKQIYARRFEITFDLYRFAIVNQVQFNPINFGIDYHKDGYEGFACFHYQDGKWVFSLYNDDGKVDCSEICKSRGGGGHKGAAGFQLTTEEFVSNIYSR
jgi:hypothetical protein